MHGLSQIVAMNRVGLESDRYKKPLTIERRTPDIKELRQQIMGLQRELAELQVKHRMTSRVLAHLQVKSFSK